MRERSRTLSRAHLADCFSFFKWVDETMGPSFPSEVEKRLLEEMSGKVIFRSRMEDFHVMYKKATANCERLSREMAEHEKISILTEQQNVHLRRKLEESQKIAEENANLKRKLEESQNDVSVLLKKKNLEDSVVPKARCSILPGPTARSFVYLSSEVADICWKQRGPSELQSNIPTCEGSTFQQSISRCLDMLAAQVRVFGGSLLWNSCLCLDFACCVSLTGRLQGQRRIFQGRRQIFQGQRRMVQGRRQIFQGQRQIFRKLVGRRRMVRFPPARMRL